MLVRFVASAVRAGRHNVRTPVQITKLRRRLLQLCCKLSPVLRKLLVQ